MSIKINRLEERTIIKSNPITSHLKSINIRKDHNAMTLDIQAMLVYRGLPCVPLFPSSFIMIGIGIIFFLSYNHLSSSPVFSGVRVPRSLVFCVVLCRSVLPFCPFSFGNCILCHSLIYGFWLTFGIFKLFLFIWLRSALLVKGSRKTTFDCLEINS